MKKLDKDVIGWIMEFILRREEVEDALINKLLANPHFPLDNNNNLRLKKTLLLRSIDSQISDGSVSETILDSLEHIERLDLNNGIPITDSMKAAYCAVAVDCTLKYLWGNRHKTSPAYASAKYLDALNRIWRGRIQNLEMFHKSHLVTTHQLRLSKHDLEAALSDSDDVRERLKQLNTRNHALLLTGAYITEALTSMGPPFLELLAREAKGKEVKENKGDSLMADKDKEKEEMEVIAERQKKEEEATKGKELRVEREKKDNTLAQEGMADGNAKVKEPRKSSTVIEERQKDPTEASSERLEKEKEHCGTQEVDFSSDAFSLPDTGGVAEEEISGVANSSSKLIVADKPGTTDLEIRRKIVIQKHKHVAERRRTKGRARITDDNEFNFEVTSSKFDTLPTPEVKQTQEMLKSSSVELQAAVDDPLPNAFRVADTVIAEMKEKNPNQETLVEKQNGIDADASDTVIAEMEEKNPNQETLVEKQNGIDADASNPSTNALTTKMASQMRSDDPTVENLKGKDIHEQEKDITRPSLIDRNSTARTYEWDDSIDDSPNTSIRLDSPKRKNVSPLRKYEVTNFAKRRKKKRWSVEEEDALRKGVQEFGRGNWKAILSSRRDIFVERTEVDLKDKWRNMLR